MNGLIVASAILVFLSSSQGQFIGYSPVLRNSINPSTKPTRGEQEPSENPSSTCVEWRPPTTYDKLIAPYATQICVKWQPLQGDGNGDNGGSGNNGGAPSYPGFGYSPFNNGAYNGNGLSRMTGIVNGGFNNGFSTRYNGGFNGYNGFNGFNGFNGGSYGSPYARNIRYGASPAVAYNPPPYFRTY